MRQTEIKVGLFVVIAALLTVAIVAWLGSGFLDRSAPTFKIVFGKASGLGEGVPVLLGGIKIGKVSQVSIRETRPGVFLSGARADQERVRTLQQQLSRARFDPHPLPPESGGRARPEAMGISDTLLVCLSAHSVNESGNLAAEIREALDMWQHKRTPSAQLIVVRLEDCEVPAGLGEFPRVDLFGEMASIESRPPPLPPQLMQALPPRLGAVAEVTLSPEVKYWGLRRHFPVVLPKKIPPLSQLAEDKNQVYLYRSYRYFVAGGTLLGSKYIEISTQDKLGRTIPVSREQILLRGDEVKGEDPIGIEDVLAKVDTIVQGLSGVLDETTAADLKGAISGLKGTSQQVDTLMQRVNQLTGESGGKIEQIVGNVQFITQAMKQLLRENKAQMSRMIADLSSASDRFDRFLQQNQPHFQRVAEDLSSTTSAVERIVTDTENNFNRLLQSLTGTAEGIQQALQDNQQEIHGVLTHLADASGTIQRTLEENGSQFTTLVDHLTTTTDSLQQMLQDNGPEIRRMLTTWADTSQAVQQTVARNEAQFDTWVENFAALTTDLRRMLQESQGDLQSAAQSLAGISSTIEGLVQGELQQTAGHLEQLTGHLEELVSDNKDNAHRMVAEFTQLSESLAAISNRLQGFLENDQWTADLERTLSSLKSSSEHLATMTESLNNLITDAQMQDSFRGTLRNLEQITVQGQQVLEKTHHLLSGDLLGGSAPASLRVDLRYRPEEHHFRSDVNLRLPRRGGSFWQLGWEDATEGDRINLQYGASIRPGQSMRGGLYRSKWGMGWESQLGLRGDLEMDLFDPNEVQLNVRTHYRLHRNWQLSLGIEDVEGDKDFIGGIRFTPGEN